MRENLSIEVVAGESKNRTQAEQDAADLKYLRELDRLRQEAGITAAMLRDGRAKKLITVSIIANEAVQDLHKLADLLADSQDLPVKQVGVVGRLNYVIESLSLSEKKWACGARKQGTAGGNDPVDCNWPYCGCDPLANKVLEAVEETGRLST